MRLGLALAVCWPQRFDRFGQDALMGPLSTAFCLVSVAVALAGSAPIRFDTGWCFACVLRPVPAPPGASAIRGRRRRPVHERTNERMMDLTIREAMPQDAELLARIYLEARRTFLGYAPLRHSDAEIRDWIARTLIPEGGTRVVERDGRAVGMYAIARRGGCGWLDQFYLLPGETGQGVGSRMMARALSELAFPVRLFCFRANRGARRFYERNGFVALRFGDGSENEEGVPDVLYGLEDRRFVAPPSSAHTQIADGLAQRR